jgi:hypothetical protein
MTLASLVWVYGALFAVSLALDLYCDRRNVGWTRQTGAASCAFLVLFLGGLVALLLRELARWLL